MKEKTGLVLEGGAMRGLFTAGVLDVFMEEGIDFDGAVGVSAGATFGCNMKSRQIGRTLRYNTRFCGDRRYGSLTSWLRTGDAYEVQFCYHTIPEELDPFDAETFEKNPMEFYVVATNLETGGPEYHRCTDGRREDLEWIRASASIPIASRTVCLEGKKLVDGGLADAVPLKFFQSLGYGKNVVVLTRPDDYRKKKNKATPLCRLLYRKYPKFVACFANRHKVYNRNIDDIRFQERAGTAFVIRPSGALPVASMEKNPEALRKTYLLGRAAAREAIDSRHLRTWLELP